MKTIKHISERKVQAMKIVWKVVKAWLLFVAVVNTLYVASKSVIALTRKDYLESVYRDSPTKPKDYDRLTTIECKSALKYALRNFRRAWWYGMNTKY